MIGRAALPLLIAAIGLSACQSADGDAVSGPKAQREAQLACLARSKDHFPSANSWEVQLQASDPDGGVLPGEFRASGNDFAWVFTTQETTRMLAVKVECTGNTANRSISGLVYDGTVRRPPAGVVWSY